MEVARVPNAICTQQNGIKLAMLLKIRVKKVPYAPIEKKNRYQTIITIYFKLGIESAMLFTLKIFAFYYWR